MKEVEEISLFELIQIIIKGWKIILITTVITLVLSIGAFFLLNEPSYIYETKASLIYSQDQYTDLGEYKFPYSKADEFIKILKDEEFIEFISKETAVDKSEIINSITFSTSNINELGVTISNSNIEITNKIYQILHEHAEDFLEFYINREAVNKIRTSQDLRLKSIEKSKS